MLLRTISDVHIEFYGNLFQSPGDKARSFVDNILPALSTDKDTTLIIAGDLCLAKLANYLTTFFNYVLPRFKHIIYVLGNHEYYNTKIDDAIPQINAAVENLPDREKLRIIGNDPKQIVIDDITFLCATLWTSYAADHPDVGAIRSMITNGIADHYLISTNSGKATPELLAQIFANTVREFNLWLANINTRKTVIVTHHLPSFRAVHPKYMMSSRDRMMNHAFVSDLDPIIVNHQPALWIFGHTHDRYSEFFNHTHLHCNPYGYPREANQRIYNNMEVLEI